MFDKSRLNSDAADDLVDLILETVPGGVVAVAPDGRIVRSNREAQRILGLSEREMSERRITDWIGITFREDGTPCPIEEFPVSRCLATGRPQHPATIGSRLPDGGMCWTLVAASPLPDRRGRGPAGALVSFLDITERKRVEERLRESEERYRTLFNAAPTGLGVAALDGTLLHYNNAMLEPGGYTREDIEAIGNVAGLYANAEDRAMVLALARSQGLVRRYPVKFKRKDGSTYDTLLSLSPTTIGGQRCWQAMSEDVTDRHRVEAELRRRSAELQAVVDAFPDLHFRAIADGTIVDYHAGSESDLFVAPMDFLGRKVQDVLPDPVGHQLHQAILHTLDQNSRVRTEYTLPLTDGPRHFEARLMPMAERQVFAVVRDVTDQKDAEEKLRQSRNQLETRVNERTEMLARANIDLRKQVSEREEAEKSLAASEARLRTLVETAPDFIMTVDRVGMIRFINRVRPPLTQEMVIGSHFSNFLAPDQEPAIQSKLDVVFRTGTSVSVEVLSISPAGEHLWYDCRIGPVRQGPDIDAATIVATDVTARKKAEAERERLLEAEQRARVEAEAARDQISALIESSSDAVWSVDTQHKLLTFNSLFRDRFQQVFQREPRVGLGPADLLPPELVGYWNQVFERALSGDRFSIEQQYTIDGEERHFDVSVNPIQSESGTIGVVVFSRDVTEHERARAQLREQATVLEATLDSISDGVVLTTHAEPHRFELFNQAAAQILGLGPVEASREEWSQTYGLYAPNGAMFPPEELPLARALRGESTDDVEMLVRRPDLPGEVWLSVSARPVVDPQGVQHGGVAAFRDITESKRAQEAMAAEQEFKERLLEAHEQERALLSYEIHDGLCQDIAAAKMHLEGTLAQHPPADPAAAEAFEQVLSLLRESIDEGRRVMNGLRPPIIDEFGVVPAIEYLVAERRGPPELRIAFTHEVQFDRLPPMLEGTLFRVTQEALTNVRRHSGAHWAHVDLTQDGDRVLLEIVDDGCGFRMEDVDKRRFGLRGIRERARLLHGKARIESAPGGGTRVRVELPLTHANPITTRECLP